MSEILILGILIFMIFIVFTAIYITKKFSDDDDFYMF